MKMMKRAGAWGMEDVLYEAGRIAADQKWNATEAALSKAELHEEERQAELKKRQALNLAACYSPCSTSPDLPKSST